MDDHDAAFDEAVAGLLRGDFSRLEPLFVTPAGHSGPLPQILEWHAQGRFADHPAALSEALTCACFLGATRVAEPFLLQGVDPASGNATGLNAAHWAANRGQLEAVRLLLLFRAPLEIRNMYGGTVLGTAVWSAIHEPRPDHLRISQELLAAGADPQAIDEPTGDATIDEILRPYRNR